jgi:ABC-2 type transport system permease protein
MSFYLYITRLKCLFRSRETMFWCYMFPILLATCFFFAFNNLWKIEDFKTITIAYDSQGAKEDTFGEVLSSANMSEDIKMFDVTYCDQTKAEKLLKNGDIDAYIVGNEKPELHIKSNSMNTTIAKSFLDQYLHTSDAVTAIMKENPNAMNEGLLDDVMNNNEYLKEVKSSHKPQQLLIYFYALLAYACVFSANWGLDEVINIQANLSSRGARLNVSPMNKMKLFFSNLMAAFTAHMGSIILVFLYMYFIIKVDFGNNLAYLFGICILGSLCGLALGGTVGIWVKKKTETKEAILTLVVLGGGFLSGMMVHQIKYIVAEKLPILGYINPVNLIADAMYSLYYYDTYERFYLDAALLLIITAFLCIASFVGIRRKNYASL